MRVIRRAIRVIRVIGALSSIKVSRFSKLRRASTFSRVSRATYSGKYGEYLHTHPRELGQCTFGASFGTAKKPSIVKVSGVKKFVKCKKENIVKRTN